MALCPANFRTLLLTIAHRLCTVGGVESGAKSRGAGETAGAGYFGNGPVFVHKHAGGMGKANLEKVAMGRRVEQIHPLAVERAPRHAAFGGGGRKVDRFGIAELEARGEGAKGYVGGTLSLTVSAGSEDGRQDEPRERVGSVGASGFADGGEQKPDSIDGRGEGGRHDEGDEGRGECADEEGEEKEGSAFHDCAKESLAETTSR